MPKQFIIFIILLLVVSCTFPMERTLYQYESQNSADIWIEGLEFNFYETPKCNIALSFLKVYTKEIKYIANDVRLISYLVSFQNKTDKIVVVDPTYLKLSIPPVNRGITAIDPEVMISEYIKQEQLEYAGFKKDMEPGLWDLLGDLADLKAHVAGSSDERDSVHESKKNMQKQRESRASQHEYIISMLSIKKNYWSKKVLRKTTLQPNQVLFGLIHFPITNENFPNAIKISFNDGSENQDLGEYNLETIKIVEEVVIPPPQPKN